MRACHRQSGHNPGPGLAGRSAGGVMSEWPTIHPEPIVAPQTGGSTTSPEEMKHRGHDQEESRQIGDYELEFSELLREPHLG